MVINWWCRRRVYWVRQMMFLSRILVILIILKLVSLEVFSLPVSKKISLLCCMRASTHLAAKSLQSCPSLCDPIDGSPPGSPVPGILQARTLEWVAISFPSAWEWKVKVKLLSHFLLLATLWTAAYQAPPSMGFSRQEYWTGVPLPSPGKWIRVTEWKKWVLHQ